MNEMVSIIVPCFEQGKYLAEALESVACQTYSNWECIIVNDGSTDSTEYVANVYVKKDIRFKYLKKENGGLSAARNSGISVATGNYILPLDADDKISADYVELALAEFEKDSLLKVVYCIGEKFGTENGFMNKTPFSLPNLSRTCMIFCTAMFKRIDWQRVGGYDSHMKYGWEDWEFWIALLKNGGNVKKIDSICFFYRIKNVSMLNSISREQSNYLHEYLSVKHADFFVNYYGSFHSLNRKNDELKELFWLNLNSEKFVIDAFFNKFFGFSIFGKLKKIKN